jgi:ADP-heptose:LPS heptosyltransferase
MQGLDAFASLRAHYDSAHISVLTTPAFASLMAAMPYFDEVLVDHRASVFDVKKTFQIKRIIASDFDIIIDMQCSKRTAGYHRLFAKGGQRWLGTAKGCSDPYPDFTKVNNRDRMVRAAQMLGAEVVAGDLSFLAGARPSDLPARYGVLMPGCSPAKPSKRWPASHFATLAEMLYRLDIVPVIIGTKVDEAACNEIAEACDFAINLCGKTNLAELASLSAGAVLCVGNDSGPVFLAAKTGAKTLMVMGPDTDPAMSAPTGANASYLKVDDLGHLAPTDVSDALAPLK